MIHQDAQDFPWGRYPTYSKSAGWLTYGQRVICVTESGPTEPLTFRGTNGSGSLHHFDGAVITYAVIRDYLPA